MTVADFNNDQRLDIAVANFGTNNIGIFLGISNGTFRAHRNFSTGSSRPRWVAIGDFNNDTQVDITVVNYGTNDIGILLGDGNGNFANWTTFSTAFDSIPYSLAVVDLNNDNKLDIVVANYGTNNVGVLFGLGNGSFTNQIIFNMGINSHPYSVTINDLNNDTHMDIVVACSGTNNIGLLLGFGNGTFSLSMKYSTGNNSSPRSVAIGDFDNDNKLDIAVDNYGTSSVGVFFGYGNGVFSDQMTFFTSSGSNPYAMITGDFNNDTRLDIALINYDYNFVDIVLTYRNYTFSSETIYRTTGRDSYSTSIALADFNNDNRLDMVVANYGSDNIGIFLGHGDGTFSDQYTYSTGSLSQPYAVAVGDFNNDSRLDIVVANYGNNNIGIFLGYGYGTFSNQRTYSTGYYSGPNAVDIGDFNNDFRLDIVVANYGNDNIGILLGHGNGTFFDQYNYSTGSGSKPTFVAVGDFNNDSQLDIAVANSGNDNVGIFLGDGNGSFSRQQTYSIGSGAGPVSIVLRDLNGDSIIDIVVVNYNIDNIVILFGFKNGTVSLNKTYSTGNGSGPLSVAITDFNNDDQFDLIVTNYQANNLGIFLGYGDGNFSTQKTFSTGNGSHPISVAVGDLNHDGHPDIAVANQGTNNAGVFIGYGNGSFKDQIIYSTKGKSNPVVVATGDFNNDNRLDIVVANLNGNNVDFFLGYGNGTFSNKTTYSTGYNSVPSSVAVGDFNNDSRLDVVVVNIGIDNIGIFLGFGNGTFSDQSTYSTGSGSKPYFVAVGYFNNDSQLDIVVANYGNDNVGIFLGYGNGSFSPQQTYSTGNGSGPQFVAVQDFNKDNRSDIVVVNYYSFNFGIFLGYGDGNFSNQSVFSTGHGSGPTSMGIGDLNNDGELDIVVTTYFNRAIGIFRGYGDGTFISLATYSTGSGSRPYSSVVVDWNNDNRLDIIVSNCETDNIVVFIGHGDGTFFMERNYSTGENSCPTSIAAGDFNSDSLLDIVVANSGTDMIGIFLKSTYMNGVREATYSTGSAPHPRAIALGDFTDDVQLDIAIANYGLGSVGVLLGHMNGTFPLQTLFSTGVLSFPTSIAVGDFNNDSKLDITVANSATKTVGILFGYGNGSFASLESYSIGSDSIPQSVTVGDFNNDNKLDIAIVDSGTNSVSVLLKYDTGAFRNQIPYFIGIGSSPETVSTGDFNNDDWLDFVVVNTSNDNIVVFFGLGNGTFSNSTTYSTGKGSRPNFVLTTDLNNDSYLDILVSNFLGNNLGVFLGFSNGSFSDQTTYSTGNNSHPAGIAVGDFNNDSRLDIVVALEYTNQIAIFYGYGNGTFSTIIIYAVASDSYPVSVAVADFNNDDHLDIVVANYGTSNIYIFQGYGNGTFSNTIIYSTGIIHFQVMSLSLNLTTMVT